MEKSLAIPMSRRDFMKLAGLAATGALLSGAAGPLRARAAARRGRR